MNDASPVALVTGASSGIGYALARMLASEGHALTVVGRQPGELELAADLIRLGDRMAGQLGALPKQLQRPGGRQRRHRDQLLIKSTPSALG